MPRKIFRAQLSQNLAYYFRDQIQKKKNASNLKSTNKAVKISKKAREQDQEAREDFHYKGVEFVFHRLRNQNLEMRASCNSSK